MRRTLGLLSPWGKGEVQEFRCRKYIRPLQKLGGTADYNKASEGKVILDYVRCDSKSLGPRSMLLTIQIGSEST